ncbi:glycosyltransferase [Phenylobacterium sp. J367]|uniref:glycosyltransferase n=1 Tax=Phenylobacterium sp. J367 TaxID=2898435 RepID=UPI002150FECF|nr:glycosyltransferase [Phenylobacterium sp. J367]MCR5879504.1 glycosyltransferase [Phenylobacterium sp. J367]
MTKQQDSNFSAIRPLRLLHVIASANPIGGGPIEGILRQNEASAGWGTREIVTTDDPCSAFLQEIPLVVHATGKTLPKSPLRPILRRYSYSPSITAWLRENASNYDAVVVNGLWNFAAMAAARALRKSKTPYFVFPHGMLDPWFKKQYPLKHVAKQIFWLFNEGPLLRKAAAVLFTTDEERLLARKSFWPLGYYELVVGYGTASPPIASPEQLAAFAERVPHLGARPYILFLSRIHPKKGCDMLIEAFSSTCRLNTELDLVIAGPDSEGTLDKLKRRAAVLGISDRVHWPGMLQGNAKWGAFYGADAFVLPSHQENFGIVVAEALGCGKPVLITDKVNIWREVHRAKAGLVAADTPQGILEMLREWDEMSDLEREDMGQAARGLFRQQFDVRQSSLAMMQAIASRI